MRLPLVKSSMPSLCQGI